MFCCKHSDFDKGSNGGMASGGGNSHNYLQNSSVYWKALFWMKIQGSSKPVRGTGAQTWFLPLSYILSSKLLILTSKKLWKHENFPKNGNNRRNCIQIIFALLNVILFSKKKMNLFSRYVYFCDLGI